MKKLILFLLTLSFVYSADAQIRVRSLGGPSTASSITPIALTNGVCASSTDSWNVTSAPIDTSGSNFIVISTATYFAFPIPAVSDNKGNTWLPLTEQFNGPAEVRAQLFYAKNAIVGANHTFTLTRNGTDTSFPAICVMSFSNVNTVAAIDQQNGANANLAVTLNTGSVTPTAANELLIADVGWLNPSTLAINSGFFLIQQDYVPGLAFGDGIAYKVQTSIAAVNPLFTAGGANISAVNIATFFR